MCASSYNIKKTVNAENRNYVCFITGLRGAHSLVGPFETSSTQLKMHKSIIHVKEKGFDLTCVTWM